MVRLVVIFQVRYLLLARQQDHFSPERMAAGFAGWHCLMALGGWFSDDSRLRMVLEEMKTS